MKKTRVMLLKDISPVHKAGIRGYIDGYIVKDGRPLVVCIFGYDIIFVSAENLRIIQDFTI